MNQLTKDEIKKIYRGYNKRTISYMECLIDDLRSQNKVVPEFLRLSLDMIADLLEVYYEAKKTIKKHGALEKTETGFKKSGAAILLGETETKIMHMLQELGATSASRMRMRKLQTLIDDSEDVLDDILTKD